MILSALYYPHTSIQSADFLKQALLLWDRVEYIAPFRGFQPMYSPNPKLGRQAVETEQAHLMQEGMELIGQAYVPTTAEKQAAHETILEIADAGIPARIANVKDFHLPEYAIYRDKLLPETWRELQQRDLAKHREGTGDDFVVNTSLGLLMMSVLTDCCLGTQSVKITDRGPAYIAIADALQTLKVLSPAQLDEGAVQDYVVTAGLYTVGLQDIGLKDVIALRKKEAKEKGFWLTQMRQNYLADAGLDLTYCGSNALQLAPGARVLCPTGIAIQLPSGFEGQIRPRSGLAVTRGLTVLNAPGTIDPGYRGEISVLLINLSDQSQKVEPGERIAQLVVAPYAVAQFEELDELGPSGRNEGGFGSTGVCDWLFYNTRYRNLRRSRRPGRHRTGFQ